MNIYNIIQQDGQMNVQPVSHNAEFADKAKKFAESHIKATKTSISLSADIYKKSLELATLVVQMSEQYSIMHQKNK